MIPYGLQLSVLIAAQDCVPGRLVGVVEGVELLEGDVGRIIGAYVGLGTVAVDERLVVIETVPGAVVDVGELLRIGISDLIHEALVPECLLPEQPVGYLSYLEEQLYDLPLIVAQLGCQGRGQLEGRIFLNFLFHG